MTHNAGKTWELANFDTLPKYCYDLLPSSQRKSLLLACNTGQVYRSDDEGKSWVIERDPSFL